MFLKEYEKLRLIGKGAFASVYKVRHLNLGYVRALKVSHEIIEDESDKSWQTFLNECRMLLRIGNGAHPNIVRIYQPRLLENKAAVEMDYVDGLPLSEYVEKTGFISIEEFKTFACQIVGALAYCHVDIYQFMMDADSDDLQPDPQDGRKFLISPEKRFELIEKYGVIHNDLHSNNIIRRHYDGQYILLDFGLAIQDDHCVKSSSRGDGAIEYTAPEKLEQNLVSKQSDVYSLGILLYEMLAGRVPFQCKGVTPESARAKVYMQHLTETPPAIEPFRQQAFEAANPRDEYRDDLPEGLTDIVMKCLSKNPEDRYADAKELYDALNKCFLSAEESVTDKPIPPAVIPESQINEPEAPEKTIDATAAISSENEKRVREEVEHLKQEIAPKSISVSTKKSRKGWKWLLEGALLIIVVVADWHVKKQTKPTMDDFNKIPYTEMVPVEGGTFTMGAAAEQGNEYDSDERPIQEVTLSDYYIGKYEVTQQLWEYVMLYSGPCADGTTLSAYSSDAWLGSNPSSSRGKGDAYPAYNVSYYDIVDVFLPRLNRITGKDFRLPTEAEWKYAARGGQQSQGYKYSGSNTPDVVAWYKDNSGSSAHPVGQKQANELGLYDMSGNVDEWCSDWYDSYSYDAQTDPTGYIPAGFDRVACGGSWSNFARFLSILGTERWLKQSRDRSDDLGFRLACSRL